MYKYDTSTIHLTIVCMYGTVPRVHTCTVQVSYITKIHMILITVRTYVFNYNLNNIGSWNFPLLSTHTYIYNIHIWRNGAISLIGVYGNSGKV